MTLAQPERMLDLGQHAGEDHLDLLGNKAWSALERCAGQLGRATASIPTAGRKVDIPMLSAPGHQLVQCGGYRAAPGSDVIARIPGRHVGQQRQLMLLASVVLPLFFSLLVIWMDDVVSIVAVGLARQERAIDRASR